LENSISTTTKVIQCAETLDALDLLNILLKNIAQGNVIENLRDGTIIISIGRELDLIFSNEMTILVNYVK
jgi:hypothetical protein